MVLRKCPEEGKCRTCRSPCLGAATTSLFNDRFEGQTYGEILRKKLAVELPVRAGASSEICMRCTKLIESVDIFVRHCQKTNDLLGQIKHSTEEALHEQESPFGNKSEGEYLIESIQDEADKSTCKKDPPQTTCLLEMDCDEDDEEEFNGFSNDDGETLEAPDDNERSGSAVDELIVKLEMEQPDDSNDSQLNNDDDEEGSYELTEISITQPTGPTRRYRGKGGKWKDEDLKLLLSEALRFRQSNGNIDHTAMYPALRKNHALARYSKSAIKTKLSKLKRMFQQPGMPKIKDRIFESDARALYG